MGNLTIAIDDDVLKRARMRALDQGTSVNAVVREQLERYAGAEDTARSAIAGFLGMTAHSHASSGARGRRWTRDELHER